MRLWTHGFESPYISVYTDGHLIREVPSSARAAVYTVRDAHLAASHPVLSVKYQAKLSRQGLNLLVGQLESVSAANPSAICGSLNTAEGRVNSLGLELHDHLRLPKAAGSRPT